MDFHPGLRIAYVEYSKVPVGQGRHAFDADTPKLSQAQFIKLLQDVGVAEPEGPVPLSTICIVFTSYKPQGAPRMLFPHFFRALGALSSEADQDVLKAVAELGARVSDLQYLTSIQVFPDKAYPQILRRGGADNVPYTSDRSLLSENGALVALPQKPGRPRPASAAAAMAPRSQSARRPSNWTGGSRHPSGATQDEVGWTIGVGTDDGWGRGQGAAGQRQVASRADAVNLTARDWPSLPNGGGDSRSVAITHVGSPPPSNAPHLKQWGYRELGNHPVKANPATFDSNGSGHGMGGDMGELPSWVNYLFARLDKLENAQQQVTEKAAPVSKPIPEPDPALAAHVAALEAQVSELRAQVSALSAAARPPASSPAERLGAAGPAPHDLQAVLEAVTMTGERLRTLTDEAIPCLEGAMTELASQVLDLQEQVAQQRQSSAQAEARTAAALQHAAEQAAVDRTQLQTTTGLVALSTAEALKADATAGAEQLPVPARAPVAPADMDRSRAAAPETGAKAVGVVGASVPVGSELVGLIQALRHELSERIAGVEAKATTAEGTAARGAKKAKAAAAEALDACKQLSGRVDAVAALVAPAKEAVYALADVHALSGRVGAVEGRLVACEQSVHQAGAAAAGAAALTDIVKALYTEVHGRIDALGNRVPAASEIASNELRAQLNDALIVKLPAVQAAVTAQAMADAAKLVQALRLELSSELAGLRAQEADATAKTGLGGSGKGLPPGVGQRVDALEARIAMEHEATRAVLERVSRLEVSMKDRLAVTEAEAQAAQVSGEEALGRVQDMETQVAAAAEALREGSATLASLKQGLDAATAATGTLRRDVAALQAQVNVGLQHGGPTGKERGSAGRGSASTAAAAAANSVVLAHIDAMEVAQADAERRLAARMEAAVAQATATAERAVQSQVQALREEFSTQLPRLDTPFNGAGAAPGNPTELPERLTMAVDRLQQHVKQAETRVEDARERMQARIVEIQGQQSQALQALQEETASFKERVRTQLEVLQQDIKRMQSEASAAYGARTDYSSPAVQQAALATEHVMAALGLTPDAWSAARAQLAALPAQAEAVQGMQQALESAQTETVKVRVHFKGLNEALENHADRLTHLESDVDKLATAVNQVKFSGISGSMKMLEGVKGADDTVASHAELTSLAVKVKHMEETLVNTLLRMDSSIAMTAARVFHEEQSVRASGGPSRGGEDRPSRATPLGISARGGAADNLHPQRDRPTAAQQETDAKVAALLEDVSGLKVGQETAKQRLKDLAQALVSLSNKCQARLSKLESGQGKAKDADADELGGGNVRSSVPTMSPVKQLDAASGQFAGINRRLTKRLDELEERLAKAEARAKTHTEVQAPVAGTSSGHQAAAPQAGGTEAIHQMEVDIKGLGDDVVALHGMLRKIDADMRQALQQCVTVKDMQVFQQELDGILTQKEAVILQLAREIGALKLQLKASGSGSGRGGA